MTHAFYTILHNEFSDYLAYQVYNYICRNSDVIISQIRKAMNIPAYNARQDSWKCHLFIEIGACSDRCAIS